MFVGKYAAHLFGFGVVVVQRFIGDHFGYAEVGSVLSQHGAVDRIGDAGQRSGNQTVFQGDVSNVKHGACPRESAAALLR